jgi:hypothetical protein
VQLVPSGWLHKRYIVQMKLCTRRTIIWVLSHSYHSLVFVHDWLLVRESHAAIWSGTAARVWNNCM